VKQLTEPIFLKLRLDRKRCTKNTFTELYENPSDGFVADTGSQADGWTTSQHVIFLLRKERLISRDEVIRAEENHIVMRFVLLCTPFVRTITQRSYRRQDALGNVFTDLRVKDNLGHPGVGGRQYQNGRR